MHILVIGAGVIGVSTAYMLIKNGHEVTLIDQESDVANGTTYANGAQLSYSFTDPFANPSMAMQAIKAAIKPVPSLRIRPKPSTSLIAWSAHFVANCTPKRRTINQTYAINLSLESADAMRSLHQIYNLDFKFRDAGKLVIYKTLTALAHVKPNIEQKQAAGFDMKILNKSACENLEPALLNYRGTYAGGIFSANDHIGDAHMFSHQLLQNLRKSNRFQTRFNCTASRFITNGTQIAGLETNQGVLKANMYVICAGLASAKLAKTAKVKLHIQPIKGFSLTTKISSHSPDISITDTHQRMVICRLGQNIRLAGYAHLSHRDTAPNALSCLRQNAQQLWPDAINWERSVNPWTGTRPMTPNGLPIISVNQDTKLAINTGHGAFGWTWAMGSAQRLAKKIGPA